MHSQAGQGTWKRTAASRETASVLAVVEARLRESPYQELRNVVADFHEGVLTIRGRVSSFYLKQLAQTVVSKLPGVEECVNRIEVRPNRQARAE